MPALIRELAVSGSRKSDGTTNASGKVFLYVPGTTTITPGYQDDSLSEAWTTDGGGIPLDAGGRVKIWINDMIDVVVTDADGATVDTMLGYNKTRAEQVEVENDGFTGEVTDSSGAVSQGLGGKTDLDTVLTSIASSAGGTDGDYRESAGATGRTIRDKFSEIWISVKDFGAVGNGIAIDTVPVQAAMNRILALGGGVCYFPPGTYIVDQGLTLTSATGVRLVGAGSRVSIIATTHTTAATFTLTSCTACTLENLRTAPVNANSGFAITVVNSADTGLHRVTQKANHDVGLFVNGTGNVFVSECSLVGTTDDCLFTGSSSPSTFTRTSFAGSATSVSIGSAAQNINITNCRFNASTVGIEFSAALSGTKFEIIGSPTLAACTTPILISTATLPVYRQWGNGIDAVALSGATGTALTPFLYKGDEVILSATSGGAGTVTVNAPAVLPSTTTSDVNLYWDFVFKNAAGGAVTWSLDAVFVVSAAIPTTDAHTIAVRFRWDRSTSKLREVSRADTVT